jgi:hypothetical protein
VKYCSPIKHHYNEMQSFDVVAVALCSLVIYAAKKILVMLLTFVRPTK